MNSIETTALETVLYGPYGVGIFVAEIILPLLFKSACRSEVAQSKSSKDSRDDSQDLIQNRGKRVVVSETSSAPVGSSSCNSEETSNDRKKGRRCY